MNWYELVNGYFREYFHNMSTKRAGVSFEKVIHSNREGLSQVFVENRFDLEWVGNNMYICALKNQRRLFQTRGTDAP